MKAANETAACRSDRRDNGRKARIGFQPTRQIAAVPSGRFSRRPAEVDLRGRRFGRTGAALRQVGRSEPGYRGRRPGLGYSSTADGREILSYAPPKKEKKPLPAVVAASARAQGHRHGRRALSHRAAAGAVLQPGRRARSVLRGSSEARSRRLSDEHRPRPAVFQAGDGSATPKKSCGGPWSGRRKITRGPRTARPSIISGSRCAPRESARKRRMYSAGRPGRKPWRSASFHQLAELASFAAIPRKLWPWPRPLSKRTA